MKNSKNINSYTAALSIVIIIAASLAGGCISSQSKSEIKTSAGTLVITDVEFVDSFPPGCTIEPGCEYPIGDHKILVVWMERKDGGNLEEISDKLMEEVLPFISEKPGNLYVTASDGSQTNLARVHEQYDKSNSRFALVFALPDSANDFKLFWPGNPAIDLGVGRIIQSNQNAGIIQTRTTTEAGQVISNKEAEVINHGDISLAIMGWSQPSGNDEIKPDEGYKFVMVDVVFANRGSKRLKLWEYHWNLRDSSGQQYDVEPRYYYVRSSSKPFGSSLMPGERTRGQILFQVPMASSGYVFISNTTWVSRPEAGEDISAVLSTQPVSLKPPTEFLTPFPGTRKIGEVITSGDLTLSVLGWESVPDDEQGMSLPKDMKYVVVELAAANHGKNTHVNYDWLIGLKDITGGNYVYSRLPNRDYPQTMDMPYHIAPGEQVRGKISFHVPKEVNDLVLFVDFYNPDTSSNDPIRVFIKLGEKPVTVPPPSQLSGEQSVQVHAVGESVQMGSFLLTVTKVDFPKGRPVEGSKLVVINITAQNTAAKAERYQLIGYLKDEKGQNYLGSGLYSQEYWDLGGVAPGATVSGQIISSVPRETRELLFVFDPNYERLNKTFIPLCGRSLSKCE